jgi:hypothetical protein
MIHFIIYHAYDILSIFSVDDFKILKLLLVFFTRSCRTNILSLSLSLARERILS